MAQYFHMHPEQPQARLVRHAVEIIRDAGLIAFPTDSAYALGGLTGDAGLLERIRRIRDVDERHHFTIMCRDLSQIATYARVDNAQYRLLKSATPGSYTFVLEGTKELPRRVLHPKRKTIGLRVPDHPVVHALLEELDEPLLTSTLILPGETLPLTDPDEIRERLEHQVDLVIEAGPCGAEATTVVDLTDGSPVLVRAGRGSLTPFGLA
ncbi:MAG TPA: L-threonylcarbamoyladenylate synthase [Rhodocyclaceae bacterium]|uniref:L-threonylcarbamoyladenylate synthase n=1 Tax=Accumulibacter sp. TaxID=2053492 RepID=UPI001A57621A|nr:L-threonylcarbamoyladenylate synthase [Accumulibacter sp.]MBL8495684.1 threonylcarbamoyl-AMP synthase [Rhodocyclaceae bacterium]HNB80144.1 L-threonylcarbamoyladenylate synthase [Rhodocyclaceae bacterium]HNC62559.1 L-threonylcarbamoyladenylate synthase [Rhodocyclaceae bacterium]HNH14192.1 L-threonylcarbamoyladenylate synthase [Rhodocyclaceae bacterium]HNH93197.1 L-threonylcarbamoyladenylate synthase [Accumulibacter sp.]